MNRWVLLEHKVYVGNSYHIHYDFLVEDQIDCFTWKFHAIPSLNNGFVRVENQPNHRLVWLSRDEYQLSKNRGLVKRIDYGTFSPVMHNQETQELKIILNGKLLNGLLIINGHLCELTKKN